jgi:hypothetical protein
VYFTGQNVIPKNTEVIIMGLLILSIVFNIIPMVILPILYKNIPSGIPAFVDLWGNTVVSMEKSYISIFRLPVMGILLSIICIMMYKTKFDNENEKINKMIWQVVAFIGSLKMGITSLEIIFYKNTEAIKYFRIIVFALVITGVIILIYGLMKMYKNKITLAKYKNGIKANKILIIGIPLMYIIIALMPVYIQ